MAEKKRTKDAGVLVCGCAAHPKARKALAVDPASNHRI